MAENIFLSLILPAHNEADRLPLCMEKVVSFVSRCDFPVEVILVENGSTDRTYSLALEYAGQYAWLRVIQDIGKGKGRAVRVGMLSAKGAYRFFADVDFSMPIEEIFHFLPPQLSAYDVAIGSREVKGAIRYDEPAFRHFTGRIFNMIVRLLAVKGLEDTQCGFKCFTAEAAIKLFSTQVLDGWAFDAEVLYIAQQEGMKIVEVPVQWYYDDHSKVNVFQDSIRMFQDLLQIRKNAREGLYRVLP